MSPCRRFTRTFQRLWQALLLSERSEMKQDSNRKMNTGWKSTNERTFVVRKFDFGKFLQLPKQLHAQSPQLFQLVNGWLLQKWFEIVSLSLNHWIILLISSCGVTVVRLILTVYWCCYGNCSGVYCGAWASLQYRWSGWVFFFVYMYR